MTTRSLRRLAPLALAATLLLTGCSGGGDTTARDPAAPSRSAESPSEPPSDPPAAAGPVSSRGLATVMDLGDGPELCLGPVAESYPPQCGGPAIAGWRWRDHPEHEEQGQVRWGSFAVTGTWDGETFTVADAIPAALYDPAPVAEPTYPPPGRDHSEAELTAIAEEVGSSLPGAQGAYADGAGHVLVDVVYDDGSLQDAVDAEYGTDVVVVIGALVDAPQEE